MPFEAALAAELEALAAAGLLRAPRVISSAQGPTLTVDGQRVVSFSSNNYLGLADHPELRKAAAATLDTHGLGAGASRLVSGSMSPHLEAERALAAFVRLETATLFSSGYAANLGTIPALVTRGDAIFSDRLSHASLIDGCRLSSATVHVYHHADPDHLEALLAEHRHLAHRALIVTDSLFSMDGDHAPLATLRALADRHDAALLVDEAHALGVLGPQGRGLCAATGVVPDVLIGTLGKAFGAAGAFAAGSSNLGRLLRQRARSYVFSTAPPPPICAAISRAAALVLEADARRATLHRHAAALRDGLRALGFEVPTDHSPIIPIVLGAPDRTMKASAQLFARGVFVQGIRPPSVPQGTSRLRLVPMATHTESHLAQALDALGSLPWR